MAQCPNCQAQTPLASPVCSECNHEKGIIETLFFMGVQYAIVLTVLYFALGWLMDLGRTIN
jgi:hypothetical protein